MNQFTYTDIYATKGIEYLIVIGFLFALIAFWRLLNVREFRHVFAPIAEARRRLSEIIEGFFVPEGFYFHPGHTWVKVGDKDTVTIGMDDFAQKMVGEVGAIHLPVVGCSLRQGE